MSSKVISQAARSAEVVFHANGWTYAEYEDGTERRYIPDATYLAAVIGDLYAMVVDKPDGYSASTGRLTVTSEGDGSATVSLELGEM